MRCPAWPLEADYECSNLWAIPTAKLCTCAGTAPISPGVFTPEPDKTRTAPDNCWKGFKRRCSGSSIVRERKALAMYGTKLFRDAVLECRRLFDEAEPPDGWLVSGRPTEIQCEDLRIHKFFSGKRWGEITEEYMKEYAGDWGACLGLMNDEAFVYYLPAFIILGCEMYWEDPFLESVLGSLRYRPQVWTRMNSEQVEFLKRFAAAYEKWDGFPDPG